MRNLLVVLSSLMLIMSAILIVIGLDLPHTGSGLLLSFVATLAGLGFFPVLVGWSLFQKSEPMEQRDRFKLGLLGLVNAAYTGLLFTQAFTNVLAEAQTIARISAVICFLLFLPWLIRHFDNKPVRWFVSASILFYAVSAA
jgi:hypothetical protein